MAESHPPSQHALNPPLPPPLPLEKDSSKSLTDVEKIDSTVAMDAIVNNFFKLKKIV